MFKNRVSTKQTSKTDGHYLYTISDGYLFILDTSAPDQTHIVSRMPIDGNPWGFFLEGDRLVLVSSTMDLYGSPAPEAPDGWTTFNPDACTGTEVARGLDLQLTSLSPSGLSNVTVIDVSNRR